MSSSIYDYVMGCLQASKGYWPKVSKGSGVSLRTLEKIARKETLDPRISQIVRLARYFEAQGFSKRLAIHDDT